MEMGRSGLIAKSARHVVMRGDLTTVQFKFKSDGSNERREGGPASWDCGLFYAQNHGRPTDLHQIGRVALFAENFSLNIYVFPLNLNSSLNCEGIKQFLSKILISSRSLRVKT